MWAHHDSWFDFARVLGHDVNADDIVLVSGWVKTSQWALAACTNYGRAHEVTLDATVPSIASAKFEINLCEDVKMSVDQRSGPPGRIEPVDDGPTTHDQCLFVKYYKMKKNKFRMKKIVAGAGPQEYPPGRDGSDSGSYFEVGVHDCNFAAQSCVDDERGQRMEASDHSGSEYSYEYVSEEPSPAPRVSSFHSFICARKD